MLPVHLGRKGELNCLKASMPAATRVMVISINLPPKQPKLGRQMAITVPPQKRAKGKVSRSIWPPVSCSNAVRIGA
ncbi:hypothetical protein D3C80_1595080 [compost metagenome]